MTDEEILKKFLDKNSHVCGRRTLENLNEEDKKFLRSRFQDLKGDEPFREIILRIKFKIEKIPKCPICGKNLKFYGKASKLYSSHCSCKCAQLDKEVKNKIRKTCLQKYGVEHNFQIPEEQKKSHSIEAIEKCFQTQKRNNSLNSSKQEDLAFDFLKEIYPDIERHHKDGHYPFNCDFYVASKDLYIECQFSMFHNYKPFTGSKEDLEELKNLKQKSETLKKVSHKKTRYDSVIETWTIRDPKKRNVVKKNKLNFKEFWNLKEVKDFVRDQKLENFEIQDR